MAQIDRARECVSGKLVSLVRFEAPEACPWGVLDEARTRVVVLAEGDVLRASDGAGRLRCAVDDRL